MKKAYWLFLLFLSATCCFGQKNLTLLSHYAFSSDTTCAGIWHYDDSLGNEYALVGTGVGLTIFNITNPASPQRIFDVPDTPGLWREVKVWSHYAYVSNDGVHGYGGGGITIVDLSNLPDTPIYKKYRGDGAIDTLLASAHTVEVFDGYLYINGTKLSNGNYLDNGGIIICSLADPWNPKYVGAYSVPNAYVHDCFARGDTLIASEIYNGQFTIINMAKKDSLLVITSNPTPRQFNHDTWMSDDDHYLFTTDELHKAPLGVFDISNLSSIHLVDEYWTSKNPVGEVHNVRVLNDFLINSCYGDSTHTGSQVTLVDASHPTNLIEVGNYPLCAPDTIVLSCWDADPFLASGNIIATEETHGLYVFAPVYKHACHIEGTVTDSAINFPLNNVKVEILLPPADTMVLAVDSTLYTGAYKTGVADTGAYDVRFTPSSALAAAGYSAKTISGVICDDLLNVKLRKVINGLHEDIPASDLLHIYPNPVHHEATVSIDQSLLNNHHHLRLLITDVLGRTVREITGINQPIITLSRNGIADGPYSIQLLDDANKIVEATIVFQ